MSENYPIKAGEDYGFDVQVALDGGTFQEFAGCSASLTARAADDSELFTLHSPIAAPASGISFVLDDQVPTPKLTIVRVTIAHALTLSAYAAIASLGLPQIAGFDLRIVDASGLVTFPLADRFTFYMPKTRGA